MFLHNEKFHVFMHVPKCGGTTVESMLADRFGPLGMLDWGYLDRSEPFRWSKTSAQHIVWDDLSALVPEQMLGRVFAVTRHPLARFVSAYNHGARNLRVPVGVGPEEWFNRTVGSAEKLPYRADNHLRRQCDFIPEQAETFRLEDGLDAVAAWLDATFDLGTAPELPASNVAPQSETAVFRKEPVSASLRQKIGAYYAEDYARFGYDLAPPKDVQITVRVPPPGRTWLRSVSKRMLYRTEHRARLVESSAIHIYDNLKSKRGYDGS